MTKFVLRAGAVPFSMATQDQAQEAGRPSLVAPPPSLASQVDVDEDFDLVDTDDGGDSGLETDSDSGLDLDDSDSDEGSDGDESGDDEDGGAPVAAVQDFTPSATTPGANVLPPTAATVQGFPPVAATVQAFPAVTTTGANVPVQDVPPPVDPMTSCDIVGFCQDDLRLNMGLDPSAVLHTMPRFLATVGQLFVISYSEVCMNLGEQAGIYFKWLRHQIRLCVYHGQMFMEEAEAFMQGLYNKAKSIVREDTIEEILEACSNPDLARVKLEDELVALKREIAKALANAGRLGVLFNEWERITLTITNALLRAPYNRLANLDMMDEQVKRGFMELVAHQLLTCDIKQGMLNQRASLVEHARHRDDAYAMVMRGEHWCSPNAAWRGPGTGILRLGPGRRTLLVHAPAHGPLLELSLGRRPSGHVYAGQATSQAATPPVARPVNAAQVESARAAIRRSDDIVRQYKKVTREWRNRERVRKARCDTDQVVSQCLATRVQNINVDVAASVLHDSRRALTRVRTSINQTQCLWRASMEYIDAIRETYVAAGVARASARARDDSTSASANSDLGAAVEAAWADMCLWRRAEDARGANAARQLLQVKASLETVGLVADNYVKVSAGHIMPGLALANELMRHEDSWAAGGGDAARYALADHVDLINGFARRAQDEVMHRDGFERNVFLQAAGEEEHTMIAAGARLVALEGGNVFCGACEYERPAEVAQAEASQVVQAQEVPQLDGSSGVGCYSPPSVEEDMMDEE